MTLPLIGGAVGILALVATWVGSIISYLHLKRTPPSRGKREGVTILKPMRGRDPNLYATLRTFLNLDRIPQDEIIFCFDSMHDPAFSLVQDFIINHPHIRATCEVHPDKSVPNPKISSILPAYRRAKNDLILISDSNHRVTRDYLWVLTEQFTPGTGVLVATIQGDTPTSFSGKIEQVYLHTFFSRWMICSPLVHGAVVGKSMVFRKSVLEAEGSLAEAGFYAAEDYAIGRVLAKKGLKIRYLAEPCIQHLGGYTFATFWDRQIRWGRLRKHHAFLSFLFEPFVYPVVGAALIAWAGATSVDVLCYLAAWFLADALTFLAVTGKINAVLFQAWAIRELLALPVWLTSMAGSTMKWRGTKYRLEFNGTVKKVG